MENFEKKYKDLVKAVKELQEANPSDEKIQNWVNDNVPELAESEDERIRKALIKAIKMKAFPTSTCGGELFICGQSSDKCIAWLEKQGEQKSKKVSLWKHWKDGKVRIHRYKNIAGNGEDKPIYLVKSGNSYTLSSCLGYECDYIELSDLDELMLSEKQDEPVEINPSEFDSQLNRLLKQFESLPKEELASSLSFYLNVIQNDGTYNDEEKQGEQEEPQVYETENGEVITYSENEGYKVVKPKFHEGEWVIWDNKISCYVDNIYQGKESLMYTITDTNNMTRSYSVKSFDNNAHLWTIQDAKDGDVLVDEDNNIGIYEEIEGICWHSYIYLGCDNRLHGFSLGGSHTQHNTKPATKEQRDTLMKEIADAGYTFDFDKKELKKIEKNPTWSEEDENEVAILEAYIRSNDWSESHVNRALGIVDELVNKLKSLKDRCTWKPSDEQLRELHCAISGCSYETPVLVELEKQLKNLL